MSRARPLAPMRAAALAAALAAAAAFAAPPAPLTPGGDARGFAQALAPRAFEFPRDHAPHPDYRQEWWYVTGNLDAADGARFGFELTFFRLALAPASAAAAAAAAAPRSAWRSRQVWLAHFAVTDVARGRFRFAHKLSREALALAGGAGTPARLWIDDWTLAEIDGDLWRLHAVEAGYVLDLTLVAQGAPVLNGEGGLSRKAAEPGAASYYYSVPRLTARGTLRREGEALPVEGLAWLDREWGSGGLGRGQQGWDWFALQLADGSALMFYALRDAGGGRDPYSAGTFVDAHGLAQPLENRDVMIEVGARWRNAAGADYPARWRLRVPRLALDVDLRPLLADQELRTTPRYWEGAVDVNGSREGRAVAGRGYVELVGYAR